MKNIFALYLMVYIAQRCVPVKKYQVYIKFYGGLAIAIMVVTFILKAFGVNGYVDSLIDKYQNVMSSDSSESRKNVIEEAVNNSINNTLLSKDYKLVSSKLNITSSNENIDNIKINRMNLVISRNDGGKEISKSELEDIKNMLSENYALEKSKISISWRKKA